MQGGASTAGGGRPRLPGRRGSRPRRPHSAARRRRTAPPRRRRRRRRRRHARTLTVVVWGVCVSLSLSVGVGGKRRAVRGRRGGRGAAERAHHTPATTKVVSSVCPVIARRKGEPARMAKPRHAEASAARMPPPPPPPSPAPLPPAPPPPPPWVCSGAASASPTPTAGGSARRRERRSMNCTDNSYSSVEQSTMRLPSAPYSSGALSDEASCPACEPAAMKP